MSSVTINEAHENLRIGDPERERAARRLQQAVAQGYLTLAEYEHRVGEAFAAETTGALRRALADLPVDRIGRQDPERRAARRAVARRTVTVHLVAYAFMVTICLVVWLAVALSAGAWYFWPIWPIIGGAIGVASHALPVRMCGVRLCGR